MNYRWDQDFHLYRSDRASEFSYSDGLDVEQRLLDAVTNALDRSTFSPELVKDIQDWPSEYHLSRRRHCLLRPLEISKGARVLELGCGCGALTRYLGEIGADVLAVEGSLMRARIAAERSRDLSNVRVVVDDLLHFQTDERFEYVLLIGVLEYAARFSTDDKPFESYLRVVTRLLAPGGKLVVAIENQLGLKYLNGCTEDHVGTRFFGVQDLYGGKTARTFGREELKSLLGSAGLSGARFYYPFPDYKLPSVVLSQAGVTDSDFNAADVVAHCTARDYDGSPYRSFDEALVADVLHRNRLLADLSNSFLVVATAAEEASVEPRELAFSWSADRIPELCTQTTFARNGGAVEVQKRPLSSVSVGEIRLPDGIVIRHQPEGAPYVRGRQLLTDLKHARARSPERGAIVEVLRPWMSYLMQQAHVDPAQARKPQELANYRIPGKLLDCTPSNLLDNGKELVLIDEEWSTQQDVPLGWVVTRGLVWSLMSGLPAGGPAHTVENVTQALCRAHKLSVRAPEIHHWLELEAAFQEAVTGKPWNVEALRHTSGGMKSFNDAVEEVNRLSDRLRRRDGELAEVQRRISARDEQIRGLKDSAAAHETILAREHVAQQRLRVQLAAAKSGLGWKLSAFITPNGWHQRQQMKRDLQLLQQSKLFDRDWYVAHNPDVAAGGQDPTRHYLQHGGFEGRDPSTSFNSQWYLDQNEDVASLSMNPLVHYLRFGATEGRSPKP